MRMKKTREEQLQAAEAAVIEREKKQFVKMTQTRMSRLIIGLGIPTTLSMMVTSLYNLADTFFVSLLDNLSVTAAASNLLPLMSIIQAIGFTFGMGSGNIVSRLLGKRDREGADKVFSSTLFISCIFGLLILGLGFALLKPMLKLFGCNGSTLGYGMDYAKWLLVSAPFMCMSFVLNNVLRAEGKAVLSMIGLIIGAVINVVLDPILILNREILPFGADMGIEGAAIATCISQVISFTVLLFMFLSGKTVVRFRFKAISSRFCVYKDVVVTGFPSFCRQILASLCTVFLNRVAYQYGLEKYGVISAEENGGDAAQTALGVVNKVFMLAFSLSLGIGQGYQPVLGYNYSAKRFERVKSAYLFTLFFSTVVMTVFAGVCAIFATQVVGIFTSSAIAKEIGALSLRLQCICMPLLPLNFMAGLTYQSVGNKALASLLSISRQGLFYLPAVLVLPKILKLLGVQMCQSIADAFAFVFAIPFTLLFFNTLKKEQAKLIEENKL